MASRVRASRVAPVARRVLILTAAVTLFAARPAAAQDDGGADLQTWVDYASLYWLSHQWRYTGDYGIRGLVSTGEWTRVYVRPDVAWHLLNWLTLTGGVGGFYTFQDDDQLEVRPFVGALAIWPRLGRWRFDHYLRLEWRNVWTYDSTTTLDSDLRLRLRVRVHTPSFGSGINGLPFYGAASFEVFSKEGAIVEQFASRTRTTLVLGHLIDQRWRRELHATLQSSRSNVEQSFEPEDFILRLRIRHHIN